MTGAAQAAAYGTAAFPRMLFFRKRRPARAIRQGLFDVNEGLFFQALTAPSAAPALASTAPLNPAGMTGVAQIAAYGTAAFPRMLFFRKRRPARAIRQGLFDVNNVGKQADFFQHSAVGRN